MSITANGAASDGVWTADELMHGKAGAPASPTSGEDGASSPLRKSGGRFSVRKLGGKKPPADPLDWGMPGHLTEEEVAVFVSYNTCWLIVGR